LLRKGQPFSPKEILSELGLPLFVKPNAGGSSLGVTKVQSEDEMREAIETAFNEGEEVMLESFLEGPEYTCGVLERKGEVVPLAVTEIRSKNEYFDFQAKYTPEFVEEITPAPLDEKRYKQCQELAVSVFKYLNCNVLARVDFILTKNGFQIIEINTVPGLTEVSIVPQMAEHEGISKTELISIMLENVL
jgi:D-alanine-D-alanine ligase